MKITAAMHLHTEFVQTKFNMDTLCLDNHQSDGNWLITWSMCQSLAESNSRLARVSAGQCLKFCDDTPPVVTLFTLDNPQEFRLLEASFAVWWTPAPVSAGKQLCSVNGVPVHYLAETGSYLSTDGECLAVLVITVINWHCSF